MKHPLSILLFLFIPFALFAKVDRGDMLKYYDRTTKHDTLVWTHFIDVRHLYTDSLQVGFRDEVGKLDWQWISQDDIDFFSYGGVYYDDRMVMGEDGKQRRIFLRMNRDSRSRVKLFTIGRGPEKRHYAEGEDSVLYRIDNVHAYRTEERVRRTGNPNYYRRFRWGVMLGMVNSDMQVGASPNGYSLPSQQYVTGGLWADLPVDPYGFSLHAEVYLHAASGSCRQEPHFAFAYNAHAISLPLTLRYTLLPLKGAVLPYVEGGVDWRCYTRQTMDGVSPSMAHGHETWSISSLSEVSTSLTLGGGIEYKVNSRHSLWLSCRYNPSAICSDYADEVNESMQDINVHIENLMFTIGYNF